MWSAVIGLCVHGRPDDCSSLSPASCFLLPNLSGYTCVGNTLFLFSCCRDAKKDFTVPPLENALLATVMAMQTDALMDRESVW